VQAGPACVARAGTDRWPEELEVSSEFDKEGWNGPLLAAGVEGPSTGQVPRRDGSNGDTT